MQIQIDGRASLKILQQAITLDDKDKTAQPSYDRAVIV